MREADIRPAKILNEYLRLSAIDAQNFFPTPGHLAPRPCPGCGAEQSVPMFAKHGFDVVTCGRCDSLYVDPAPKSEGLDAFYRDSPSTSYWANVFFPAVAEARRSRIFNPRAARVLALAEESGTAPRDVLDVGAGAGLFLEELSKQSPSSKLSAIEPGADLARALREKGIETFEGFAEEAADEWKSKYDIVTCFEVFEHVLDPLALVMSLGALARPGGLVIVSGLCGDGFDIRMLGVNSQAVSPPHHLNFLSRTGVESVVTRAGLSLVRFWTPGDLDIDIVSSALAKNPNAVADLAVREELLKADESEKAELQARLVAECRSSHMWFAAKRTG